MKTRCLYFAFCLSPLLLFAQLQEDFSRNHFSSDPVWLGDTSRFLMEEGMLRSHSDIAADVFYLSTALNLEEEMEWSALLKLDFKTSSANYVELYLYSDQIDPRDAENALFLRIGNTKDEVVLWQRRQGNDELLIDGKDGQTENKSMSFKVMAEEGQVSLSVDYGIGWELEGSVALEILPAAAYFSWLVKQSTASFHKKHYLDNVYAGPVFHDTIPPVLTQLEVLSPQCLELSFSEVPEAETETSQFSLTPPMLSPDSLYLYENKIQLWFETALANGDYTLNVRGIKDSLSNRMSDSAISFSLRFAEPLLTGDILINEVLFNPYSGGTDFIELFNASDKLINLEGLHLARVVDGQRKDVRTFLSERYLLPGAYVVICAEESLVLSFYNAPEGVFYENKIPPMNNDEGFVLLLDSQLVCIDSIYYSADYHLPLLNEVKGVSLERVRSASPGWEAGNWHSASSLMGFATPGYKNSQALEGWEASGDFSLRVPRISPDADGFEDYLELVYKMDEPGYILNAYVFDLNGRLRGHIINNQSLSNSGLYAWDGLDEKLEKCPSGNYVLFLEAFHMNGKILRKKLAFSVVSH